MCQHPDFLNMSPVSIQKQGQKNIQHCTDVPLWSLWVRILSSWILWQLKILFFCLYLNEGIDKAHRKRE